MRKRLLSVAILMTIISSPLAEAEAQGRRTQSVDLLVLGGTIVTMDQARQVISDGGIAVSQGRIIAMSVPCGQTMCAAITRSFRKPMRSR